MENQREEIPVTVPTQLVGPVRLAGPEAEGDLLVPLATFESPLWPSVDRGAAATRAAGGIRVVVTDDRMARSILLEADAAADCLAAAEALRVRRAELARAAEGTSRFAKLVDHHVQLAGNLLFVRLEFTTGDAAGHNMVTQAADAAMRWMLESFPRLRHVSVSGNYCTDKKVSAVNGILGRGKGVIAEAVLPAKRCRRFLKATPEAIVALNVRKNLIGSILAGGVRSANAHFANMLLALYLATGQDAANIVEGSQGLVHAETRPGADGAADLYFSVTVPNVIVGTVGQGKDLAFARRNLERMGCLEPRPPGANARRLAAIAGAVVLCGELSLLAAQTNPGELMRAHVALERKGRAPR